jgi:hypothetical protein
MAFDALSGFSAPVRRDGAPQSDRPAPPPIDGDRPRQSRDSYERGSDRPAPPPIDGGRRDYDRPAPPPVRGGRDYDRPAPPPVGNDYGYDRPTPPPVNGGYDRPAPPPVRPHYERPRYFWMPSFPVFMPTNPQPIAKIAQPPAPAPARKVDMNEVGVDVFQLLGEAGRLRQKKYFLWIIPYHSKISAGEAKSLLAAGKPVHVGPDSGWHFPGKYAAVTTEKGLDGYLSEARSKKLNEMQRNEDNAYHNRVEAWRQTDIQNRLNHLPAFNSVWDTNRMMLPAYLISEDGRQFNRSLVTAMNIYNQPETRREIARRWSENPTMSTGEFNMMANQVVANKASNLYWNASYAGSDWGVYLGSNPVPGLRYPDYQEDVEWNAAVIRRTASELPLLLNASIITN